MGSGLTRLAAVLAASLILCVGIVAASAGACPGNPNALGTSRTIVVDPREHGRIGTMDYEESLPLNDREVVLTFDDGPLPPYTNKVLDILASHCVKMTYFVVGEMAKAYPAMVRRAYDEGHTIGTHSMSHPIHFRAQPVDRGNAQIDDGIAATAAVLGDAGKVAPFFRFPGFGWTDAAHRHARERGLMVWGADVPADDWLLVGSHEVARRALHRLEAKGKGILLLHDIHKRTVDALPILLDELKARGFRVVHVVPASPERPATVTAAADWLPNARRIRVASVAPVILISDVQDPEGERYRSKSIEQLCSLGAPGDRALAIKMPRKHQRMALADGAAAKPGHGKGKPPAKVAEAVNHRPDIHGLVR
jgi:peptidoglycan/xylan/chitin deacetylase (PgdA/CDA1 family)